LLLRPRKAAFWNLQCRLFVRSVSKIFSIIDTKNITNNCLGRIHERFGGKGYFFSWKEASTVGKEKDWLDGRNYCRQRCMDLVSLETKAENEFVKSRIVRG
jgi:hypothetical protein